MCVVFKKSKGYQTTILYSPLHQELVESSSKSDIFSLKLCSFCVNSLRKKKIPKLSIADGYDYGRIERLPEIQSLTLVEKTFDCVDKVEHHGSEASRSIR